MTTMTKPCRWMSRLSALLIGSSLAFIILVSTQPLNCGDSPSEYFFLDQHAVDTSDPSSLNNLGNFPFCLPGTRTWLRHAYRPRLRKTQAWELLVRSDTFSILGRAFFTLDQSWNRLTCHNGTFFQTKWGITTRNYDPSEQGKGLWEGYTDSMYNEFWTYGFICSSSTTATTIQGICVRKFCCQWDIGTPLTWLGNSYIEGWLHPVGGGRTMEWDHTGPQRCGGISTDLYLLHRQDPLHPVGTAPRNVNLSELPKPRHSPQLSAWQSNTYVQLLQRVARTTNLSDCWICSHTPAHIEQGVPFIATPLTLQQYKSNYLLNRNLTFLKPNLQYIYLSGETKGPVCKEFSGTGDHVGSSVCTVSIQTDPEGNSTWVRNGTHSRSYPTLQSALTAVLFPFIAEAPHRDLIETFQTGRIEEPLSGLFWVCSSRAYTWVSVHMQGSCFLGHIHPGFRVTRTLSLGISRNKRSPTTPEKPRANGETWLRALLPAYGAFSNHLDILRLTDVLLRFINESEATTMSVLTELTQVRAMTIQNRLCLDLLLSAQGGACKLIGAECCSYITDQTLNVTAHLRAIDSLTQSLKNIQHEGITDWDLWAWLPSSSWLRDVVKGVLLVTVSLILLLLLLCCCSQCFPAVIASLRPNSLPTRFQAPVRQTTGFPELVPMYHLGEGEYATLDVRQ